MGKAQVKFTILVNAKSVLNPEVTRLQEMGHTIVPAPIADLYLDDATLAKRTFVEAALKGARARRKEAKDESVP